MHSKIKFKIALAKAKQDFETGKKLFLEYSQTLHFDLCFQSFDQELAAIDVQYNEPNGGLLLLFIGVEPIGCAGIRRLDEETAELKRMYIKKDFRGKGLGKILLKESMGLALRLKYKRILLDTLPSMKEAIHLYQFAGFKETEPYRNNPIEGAIYFEMKFKNGKC